MSIVVGLGMARGRAAVGMVPDEGGRCRCGYTGASPRDRIVAIFRWEIVCKRPEMAACCGSGLARKQTFIQLGCQKEGSDELAWYLRVHQCVGRILPETPPKPTAQAAHPKETQKNPLSDMFRLCNERCYTAGASSMSLIEFILAFIGVMVGLGVSDLLVSFHKLLRAGSKVKWDWLTILYATLMLYASVIFWFNQLDYLHAKDTLTIWTFLPNFIQMVIGFLMVASALPDDVPSEGIDLRKFYIESIRHRWGLLSRSWFANIIIAITNTLSHGRTLTHRSALMLGCIVFAALAMRYRSTWYQVFAIAWIIGVASYFSLFLVIGP